MFDVQTTDSNSYKVSVREAYSVTFPLALMRFFPKNEV